MDTPGKAGAARAPGTPERRAREHIPIAPSADQVALVTVGDDGAGQRLDNYLMKLAKGVPKSHLYRIVRSGEVRVNRARARVDQRLAPGDVVRIPPLRTAAAPTPLGPVPLATLPPVLYEDEHLLVVDKPAGLAVHGGSGVAFGLIERLRAARPQLPFLELAHRLDRETSGALLLAKSRRALVRLHEALREGHIDKHYLALAVGRWANERRHVRAPLRKFLTKAGERRVSVEADGLPSHTIFTLRQRYAGYSLIEAQLKTGRTHQIRVHLAHLGHPIVGDDKYGDFEVNRRFARGEFGVGFDRMFLHAWRLELSHPLTGERLVLEARLPDECETLLEALRRA
jgi:23S rRNA pseudouridine955/2504/2580 synthase